MSDPVPPTPKTFWPYGLIIFYCSFVVAMIGLVVYLSFSPDEDLVSDNYYARSLTYQTHIDSLKRTAEATDKLSIVHDEKTGTLLIQAPSDLRTGTTGTVVLYRPSDAKQDTLLPLALNAQGVQTVDMSNRSKGAWRVKLSWQHAGLDYYREETIFN